jgi:GDPmannose 4,6-dehydratase
LDYREYVVQDPKFYRPAEVDLLISDPSRAHNVLGWEPSVTFRGLVEMMVQEDIEQLSRLNRESATKLHI